MSTITLSVGPLANVFLLLFLTLFIFSILAMFFFRDITSGFIINDYRNYLDWGKAMISLFIIATGESWNYVMFDCMITEPNCEPGVTCGTSFAPIYYMTFVMVVQNVMLNLFVLVIIS